MSEIIEPSVEQQPVLHDLAQQKKSILQTQATELGADVSMLDFQLGQLSPQAALTFNSSTHPDVKEQIAKTAMSLMRICASLDIDLNEAIESRILAQEAKLFGQQNLQI